MKPAASPRFSFLTIFSLLLLARSSACAGAEDLIFGGAPGVDFPKEFTILEGAGRSYVYVNGTAVWDPTDGWGSRMPISVFAGDTVRISFRYQKLGENYGGWFNAIHLWNLSCGASMKINDLYDAPQYLAPPGAPVEGPEFFARTYRVVEERRTCPSGENCIALEELSCEEPMPLKIISMKPLRRGGVKLRNSLNQVINTRKMEFPPEVIYPRSIDGQVVVFEMFEAPSRAAVFQVSASVSPTGSAAAGVFPSRRVVFRPGSRRARVVYQELNSRLPIAKSQDVEWKVSRDGVKLGSLHAPKTMYFVHNKPLGLMAKPRVDILDLACELSAGAQSASDILGNLQRGLYNKYKYPTRTCGRGHYVKALKTFFFGLFLADNQADSADLAILHMLMSNALGIEQETARLVENENRTDTLTLAKAHFCLGQFYPAMTPVSPNGWHQVSFFPFTRNEIVWDPSMMFEDDWGNFDLLLWESLKGYRRRWAEKRIRWQVERVRFVQ